MKKQLVLLSVKVNLDFQEGFKFLEREYKCLDLSRNE